MRNLRRSDPGRDLRFDRTTSAQAAESALDRLIDIDLEYVNQ